MNVMAITNLYAISTMPDEKLIESIADVQVDEKALKNFYEAMAKFGFDLDAITEGWDKKEKTIFLNLIQLWVGSFIEKPDGYMDGYIFVLTMKHFLIPTLEKKKALEKMLTLTGKEES